MNNNLKVSNKLNIQGIRAIARDMFFTCFWVAILLIAAGTTQWPQAWIYGGLSIFVQAAVFGVLIKFNPILVNERGKMVREGVKNFDRVFVIFYLLFSIATAVIAGFDVKRFGWSLMPHEFMLPGIILFILSFIPVTWAMVINKHFETTVRIQTERDHKVCDQGPYKIVRHPGYAALLLGAPSCPMILGSYWAFIGSVLIILLFVVRTALEDKTLQEELPGYKEFALSTRYRLIPFVW